MKRSVFLFFQPALALAVLMTPLAAVADATTALVKRLAAVDSLSGQFEQVVLDRGGTRLQEASGDMQMARGNRFRWHTLEPYEQLAVSDGVTVWVYDVDLEQVVEKPLGQETANTPALLFGGNPDSVAEVFVIEEISRHGREVSYRLSPRQDDTLFVALEVTFRGEMPHSMRLEDALGQMTTLDFRNTRINTRLDASRFQFVAPEGADVIRQQ
ncbi:MAG: outer membrane lipoprotein carrier protein LolA [Gammaproteobacteria bacterium HGW-Gammaproteobacteria-14]|nr:MAG: outer membrane lipoprotein carrier protein LolA [Gammaproteobacteria bacterium HGW-Gammaproteobacteria-14]